MADERHYIVKASAFNGTTVVPITEPWLPGPDKFAAQKLRSVDLGADPGGRFTPEVLGRPAKGISLARVWTDGPLADGDSYTSLGSATSTSPAGIINASPVSINRGVTVPLGLGPRAAKAIELGPTDVLSITKAAGDAPVTAHIVIIDLDEDEAYLWSQFNNEVIELSETTETRSITVTAGPVDIAPWSVDILYIEARATAASGTLRLPARSNFAPGAKVRIARTDGLLGGEHFVLIASGLETINNSTSPIRFSHDAMGVWIENDANGWIASSAPDNTTPVTLSGTQTVPQSSRMRTLVEWTPSPSDSVLTLPATAGMAVDQEIEVMCVNAPAAGGTIIPALGEQIDSVVNRQVPVVRRGDSFVFRRTATGGWLSYNNGNPLNRDTFAIVADPALGASVGWDGLRHYRCTYGAPGNFTLPTAPKLGTEIVVSQSNAQTVTLQAGGNVIIAGGTALATFALAIDEPIHLRFLTGAWVQM